MLLLSCPWRPVLLLLVIATQVSTLSLRRDGEDGGVRELSLPKLAWLHTPKAGTSFANVLIAWGCPEHLSEMHGAKGGQQHHAPVAHKFCKAHIEDCPVAHTLCSSHSPLNFAAPSDYKPAIHNWAESRGNFVAMFRKPEQRHMSAFMDDQIMSTYSVEVFHGQYGTPLEYAMANQGCTVKLLNGVPCNDQTNASVAMIETAKNVLKSGFAYVGLTEEWELSVCLFHRMFGGKCDEREFSNLRPGGKDLEKDYNTSEFDGWHDPLDGPLYDHARLIFWSNVAKYNLSWDLCRTEICPSAASFF